MEEEMNRKLTEAEIRRCKLLEEMSNALAEDGYLRKDQLVSIVLAGILAFFFVLPFVFVFGAVFVMKNGLDLTINRQSILWIMAFVLLYCILIVVHEGLHGITWGIFAKHHYKSIEFGFIKEYMTPYCTCTEPLGKGAYILGAFMPCLMIGILPCIAGILVDSLFLLLTGLFMILGAGGDLTIIVKILSFQTEASSVIFMDHPTACGFIVFEKQESHGR